MKKSGLAKAFAGAALATLFMWNQNYVGNRMADDYQSGWQDFPESASQVTFEKHVGVFNVLVSRSYQDGNKECRDYREQSHFIGVPMIGSGSAGCITVR